MYTFLCVHMCIFVCFYEIWSQISIRTILRKGWKIHIRLELWFYTSSFKVAYPGSPWVLMLGHAPYCLQTDWFDCLTCGFILNGTPLLMTTEKGWTYITTRLMHFYGSLALLGTFVMHERVSSHQLCSIVHFLPSLNIMIPFLVFFCHRVPS